MVIWVRLPQHTANRLQRWGTVLLNHNSKIVYLPSNKFGHADGLSRFIFKYKEPLEDTVQSEGELKISLAIQLGNFQGHLFKLSKKLS